MTQIINKIDEIISELQGVKEFLNNMGSVRKDNACKDKNNKRYVVCNEKGEVVLIGSRFQIFGFLKIGEKKMNELIESGDSYNGFTIDISN